MPFQQAPDVVAGDAPRVGTLPSGPLDLISDVAGVKVGHATIAEGERQTPLGRTLAANRAGGSDEFSEPEKGSIIMIVATDAPLDTRQLGRVAKRAGAGLARMGSVYGHGSGDIALAFSTAYQVPHLPDEPMPSVRMLHESHIDALFEACAEAVEQAIVHAMWRAASVTGRDGHSRRSILEALPDWRSILDPQRSEE